MTDSKDCVLESVANKKGIGSYSRHLLFCGGGKCVDNEIGEPLWEHLKERYRKEPALAKISFRTKTKCLRVCCQGPIVVVYPEGTWYANVDKQVLDRILDEHVLQGKVLKELAFAENPLSM